MTQNPGWLEVSVRIVPEAAEAVAEVLSRFAPQGVVIDLGEGDGADAQPVAVKAYLAAGDDLETRRHKVEEAIWYLHHIWPVIPDPIFRPVADQDWTAGWKASIPVMHLGARVVIKPSWRDYPSRPGELVLEMDPGLAFGTGLHPTTQLCVAALEDFAQSGMHVLDLGTGTGILALVAAKLGVADVLAVDTDLDAVHVTGHNARRNNVADVIRPLHGSLAEAAASYDLVVANILAHIIIDMAKSGLAARVKPGGTLVVSGILAEQADEVAAVLDQQGLRVTERRRQDDWVALVARKAFGIPPSLSHQRLV